MQTDAFRRWLEGVRGYSANTVNSRISGAKRVEEAYGDLDTAYDDGTVESIVADMSYSPQDARAGRPNPSRIQFNGDIANNLASYRAAIALYRAFRSGPSGTAEALFEEVAAPIIAGEAREEIRQRIGLERDLQSSLRRSIAHLHEGLAIIDNGLERVVQSGRIDITARDSNGAIVAIELKAGTADRAAVGQIAAYMGDLMVEEPDTTVLGILVAADFHPNVLSAARAIPGLSLKRYAVTFDFSDPT